MKSFYKIITKDKWQQCEAELKSIFFTRDLINLPPNILTPKIMRK